MSHPSTNRYRGKTIIPCSKDVRTRLWMMPLTSSIYDAVYEMGHLVRRASPDERRLANKNVGDVVNLGVTSDASEFGFAQNVHKTTTKATSKESVSGVSACGLVIDVLCLG